MSLATCVHIFEILFYRAFQNPTYILVWVPDQNRQPQTTCKIKTFKKMQSKVHILGHLIFQGWRSSNLQLDELPIEWTIDFLNESVQKKNCQDLQMFKVRELNLATFKIRKIRKFRRGWFPKMTFRYCPLVKPIRNLEGSQWL